MSISVCVSLFNVCVYVGACMHVRAYACARECGCVHVWVYRHATYVACVYVCACIFVYVYVCACAYGCVHDCVYLQACVRGVCVSEPKIVSLFTLSSLAHSYACRAKYLQNTQYWNSPLQLAPVAPVHVTQPRHLAVHHQLSLSQIHTILLKLY